MRIEKIDFYSNEFNKIKRDAPKDIIVFNSKTEYYCLKKNNQVVSICGIYTYKNKHKITSAFTYIEHRKKGYMLFLINYLLKKMIHKHVFTHANEDSYKIFERLNFEEKSFKQYKKFTRRVMVLKVK